MIHSDDPIAYVLTIVTAFLIQGKEGVGIQVICDFSEQGSFLDLLLGGKCDFYHMALVSEKSG